MFVVTPYTFQPLFQRFITLWIYIQYVTDCMTVVLSYICCRCCEPRSISLSTSCAAIVELNDVNNDVKTLSVNDVNMSSGEPAGNGDVIIDVSQPDLLISEYKPDLQNTNELLCVDTLECTEKIKDVRLEMPSCSRYCDHPEEN